MTTIPNELLREIYATDTVQDAEGNAYPVHSGIPCEYAEVLYDLVKENLPKTVVEVGLAFGLSSLAILTALEEIGGDGRLVSIDPNQERGFHGVGLANIERAGFAGRHEHVADLDYFALPDLLRRLPPVEFAYIDGWHTFDHVLLDFFYLDKMLAVGGIVGFNDCKWPAVQKGLGFLKTHRRYEAVKTSFKIDKEKGRLLKSLYRRYAGAPDEYFRKVEDFSPGFDFFAEF